MRMMRIFLSFILGTIIFNLFGDYNNCFIGLGVSANLYRRSTPGVWSDTAQWSPQGLPGSLDSVTIPDGICGVLDIDQNVTVLDISVLSNTCPTSNRLVFSLRENITLTIANRFDDAAPDRYDIIMAPFSRIIYTNPNSGPYSYSTKLTLFEGAKFLGNRLIFLPPSSITIFAATSSSSTQFLEANDLVISGSIHNMGNLELSSAVPVVLSGAVVNNAGIILTKAGTRLSFDRVSLHGGVLKLSSLSCMVCNITNSTAQFFGSGVSSFSFTSSRATFSNSLISDMHLEIRNSSITFNDGLQSLDQICLVSVLEKSSLIIMENTRRGGVATPLVLRNLYLEPLSTFQTSRLVPIQLADTLVTWLWAGKGEVTILQYLNITTINFMIISMNANGSCVLPGHLAILNSSIQARNVFFNFLPCDVAVNMTGSTFVVIQKITTSKDHLNNNGTDSKVLYFTGGDLLMCSDFNVPRNVLISIDDLDVLSISRTLVIEGSLFVFKIQSLDPFTIPTVNITNLYFGECQSPGNCAVHESLFSSPSALVHHVSIHNSTVEMPPSAQNTVLQSLYLSNASLIGNNYLSLIIQQNLEVAAPSNIFFFNELQLGYNMIVRPGSGIFFSDITNIILYGQAFLQNIDFRCAASVFVFEEYSVISSYDNTWQLTECTLISYGMMSMSGFNNFYGRDGVFENRGHIALDGADVNLGLRSDLYYDGGSVSLADAGANPSFIQYLSSFQQIDYNPTNLTMVRIGHVPNGLTVSAPSTLDILPYGILNEGGIGIQPRDIIDGQVRVPRAWRMNGPYVQREQGGLGLMIKQNEGCDVIIASSFDVSGTFYLYFGNFSRHQQQPAAAIECALLVGTRVLSRSSSSTMPPSLVFQGVFFDSSSSQQDVVDFDSSPLYALSTRIITNGTGIYLSTSSSSTSSDRFICPLSVPFRCMIPTLPPDGQPTSLPRIYRKNGTDHVTYVTVYGPEQRTHVARVKLLTGDTYDVFLPITCVMNQVDCVPFINGGGDINNDTFPAVCPSWRPFRCADGRCQHETASCNINPSMCPSNLFSCWDGSCASNVQSCPSLPRCPSEYPRRCAGYCGTVNDTCGTTQCRFGLNVCEDGSCFGGSSNSSLCPSFYGCGLFSPFHCLDGRCASKWSDCFIDAITDIAGVPIEQKEHCANMSMCACAAGGVCAATCSLCPPLPFVVKPQALSLTMNSSVSLKLQVAADTNNSNIIITVDVPPETLSGGGDTVLLSVLPVPDSSLYTIAFNSSSTSSSYNSSSSSSSSWWLGYLLSPVMSLTATNVATSTRITSFGDNKNVSITFRIDSRLLSMMNGKKGGDGQQSITGDDNTKMCLGYIDETLGRWECIDRHLVYVEEDDTDAGWVSVRGQTTHFTSFAMLVDSRFTSGNNNNNKPSVLPSNNDKSTVGEPDAPFPLAVAVAVPVAGVVGVVAVIGVWMYVQRRKRQADMDKQIIEDREL
eukprot:TRINITY_DN3137_c0_g1_i5.p1 TRINITY_DN3137_c0_g1~~TRINITY_DN3137_c0_g1_i5.p1  ORF type:complete len:1462 (+),score=230.85 TRINITY_DN3137_c0_g1_i5:42-4427(+)